MKRYLHRDGGPHPHFLTHCFILGIEIVVSLAMFDELRSRLEASIAVWQFPAGHPSCERTVLPSLKPFGKQQQDSSPIKGRQTTFFGVSTMTIVPFPAPPGFKWILTTEYLDTD